MGMIQLPINRESHIKAARLFSDNGRQIKAGDVISYVKTRLLKE
jgi:hypothetical protein